MKQKLVLWLLGLALWIAIMAGVYRCLTFPIFGHHSPACICEECFDKMDRERGEVAQ
jgi:hypothetical protein